MVSGEVHEHVWGNVLPGYRALMRAPARLGERFRGFLFPTGNSTDYGGRQEPAAFPGLRWKDDFLLILQDCGFHLLGSGVYLEDGSVRVNPDGSLFDAVCMSVQDLFFSPLDSTAGEIA